MSSSAARGSALVWLVVALLLAAGTASGHEFRPAVLQVSALDEHRYVLRLVAPPASSAGTIADGELAPIVPEHCSLDPRGGGRFGLDCGARGLTGAIGVAGLDRHPVDVFVAVRHADGTELHAVLGPEQPTLTLAGDRTPAAILSDYLRLGVEHILAGVDHLLFVFGLVLLADDRRKLIATVTAFTLAHSLTLASAALDWWTLPGAPVEAAIALSIVVLARELIQGHRDERARETVTWRAPWAVALGFGLLHGFGFAGALAEVGLPQQRVPLALLGFNLGVEVGQLLVVFALLGVFAGLGWARERLAWSDASGSRARLAAAWTMGVVASAWTIERVLGLFAPG